MTHCWPTTECHNIMISSELQHPYFHFASSSAPSSIQKSGVAPALLPMHRINLPVSPLLHLTQCNLQNKPEVCFCKTTGKSKLNYFFFTFRLNFQFLSHHNAGISLWLGLGTKPTWLWLGKQNVLDQNIYFGHHDHRWSWKIAGFGRNKNSWKSPQVSLETPPPPRWEGQKKKEKIPGFLRKNK